MNKLEIRPLLVENLEKLKTTEDRAAQEAAFPMTGEPRALIRERYMEARFKRAQAELQLWLADRQWEREALEVSKMEYLAQNVYSPSSKAKPAE